MYVATVLGCREYLGFDASPNAISSAHAIPVPVGLSARFEVADFGRPPVNTGCPPAAALAYDSLYLAKDLPARPCAAFECSAANGVAYGSPPMLAKAFMKPGCRAARRMNGARR